MFSRFYRCSVAFIVRIHMAAPSWKLHQLHNKGRFELKGHFSVSVSGNWRLTFMFDDEDVILVDYVDYH